MAALTFGAATTDRVDCGSAASLDDLSSISVLAWVYPTSLVNDKAIVSKYRGTAGEGWILYMVGTSGAIGWRRERATTDQDYVSNTGFLTADLWNCVGVLSDTTDAKVYYGTLTSRMAEVTYSSSAGGSGILAIDASRILMIGNRDAATPNAAFPGDIALAMVWNRRLSEGELFAQQFNPRVTSGCVLYVCCGFNGTGTQADWSGNVNNGTVTGATLSTRGLPIGPLFGFDLGWMGAFTAAAGRTTKNTRSWNLGQNTGMGFTMPI